MATIMTVREPISRDEEKYIATFLTFTNRHFQIMINPTILYNHIKFKRVLIEQK